MYATVLLRYTLVFTQSVPSPCKRMPVFMTITSFNRFWPTGNQHLKLVYFLFKAILRHWTALCTITSDANQLIYPMKWLSVTNWAWEGGWCGLSVCWVTGLWFEISIAHNAKRTVWSAEYDSRMLCFVYVELYMCMCYAAKIMSSCVRGVLSTNKYRYLPHN